MSNVKPGDLARVIHDPTSTLDGKSNVGKQCLVLRPASCDSESPQAAEFFCISRKYGQIMEVEALEHFWVHRFTRAARVLELGGCLWVPQSMLQRIDPPADSLDLMRTEPLPGEHRSMEDLQDYIKEHS